MATELVIVYFDQTDTTDDGEPYGNAITETDDPIEYDITQREFTEHFPDSIWVSTTL